MEDTRLNRKVVNERFIFNLALKEAGFQDVPFEAIVIYSNPIGIKIENSLLFKFAFNLIGIHIDFSMYNTFFPKLPKNVGFSRTIGSAEEPEPGLMRHA